jgi:hypothetical protein
MFPPYQIAFSNKPITPFGGVSLLSQLLDRVRIKDVLSASGMPEQGSNRGYDPVQLILNFRTAFGARPTVMNFWRRRAEMKSSGRYMAGNACADIKRSNVISPSLTGLSITECLQSFSNGSLAICLSTNTPWILTRLL